MFTIRDVVFPAKIMERLAALHNRNPVSEVSGAGTEVNFACGSFVRFFLVIDEEAATVTDARFSSNGCGFMLAAADVLAERISHKSLSELHGLENSVLRLKVEEAVGTIPAERNECVAVCINALHSAFADFRSRKIEEFRGEKPLICTCFGVTEETLEFHIADKSLKSVDEVGRVCNAGSGCGSCRMLIQEILDG